MRYARAVGKLRELAEECERLGTFPSRGESFLVEMYAFGEVLEGTDPLDVVQIAGVINLPSEDVPWYSCPRGTAYLAESLRLSKGGYEYWWRSHRDPVWNHCIQRPVRIWSRDGVDEDALAALASRRFGDLNRLAPEPEEERRQLLVEGDVALRRLREVRERYWDYDWRREHKALDRYPENELWDAVAGYLDLLDARERPS
jgi:hypothetical protein